MNLKLSSLVFVALSLAATGAISQSFPTEFQEGSVPVTNELLKEKVFGKKFVGKRAGGRVLKMEYGNDGSYRIGSDGAGILDGKVRMDGAKLCQDMIRTLENSCNDVRVKDNQLFYKRNTNGEIITYTAQ